MKDRIQHIHDVLPVEDNVLEGIVNLKEMEIDLLDEAETLEGEYGDQPEADELAVDREKNKPRLPSSTALSSVGAASGR